jgi:hypothetical protein
VRSGAGEAGDREGGAQRRERGVVEVAAISLAVMSIGPVTERLLVQIPEPTTVGNNKKMDNVPLSKVLNPNCSCKSLWIRASAK